MIGVQAEDELEDVLPAELRELDELQRIARRLGPARMEELRAELRDLDGGAGGEGSSGRLSDLEANQNQKRQRGGYKAQSKTPQPRCAGSNRVGEPCTSVAVIEEFCAYHANQLVDDLRAEIARLEAELASAQKSPKTKKRVYPVGNSDEPLAGHRRRDPRGRRPDGEGNRGVATLLAPASAARAASDSCSI